VCVCVCVFVSATNHTVLFALAVHHLGTADGAQSGFSEPGTVWLLFFVSAPAAHTHIRNSQI